MTATSNFPFLLEYWIQAIYRFSNQTVDYRTLLIFRCHQQVFENTLLSAYLFLQIRHI